MPKPTAMKEWKYVGDLTPKGTDSFAHMMAPDLEVEIDRALTRVLFLNHGGAAAHSRRFDVYEGELDGKELWQESLSLLWDVQDMLAVLRDRRAREAAG
jgi:hypothetical protein